MVRRWRAPGRVNLIGEHTDYNEGFALPFALDVACVATVETRSDGQVVARSVQREESVSRAVDDLRPGSRDWADYVLGVAWVLRERGHRVEGLTVEVDSSVPVGSGLSSSAALVCSVTRAVDDLLRLDLTDDELLQVTRSVENDFLGAPTGGMDQLASLRCTPDHALFCDMRSLAAEQVALPLEANGLRVLVVDSRTAHRHAEGEYARRHDSCAQAARLLGVAALRDVRAADLDAALVQLPEDELRRCVRHIVTENERVVQTVELLRTGAIGDIGPLLTASHTSMRDDYRITTVELDTAVEALLGAGALGARMTGGGFGGCVIALIATPLVAGAGDAVRQAYVRHGFSAPNQFVIEHAADGANAVSDD